jgi:pimeloyl-ACP methyl ester carboxylesterase
MSTPETGELRTLVRVAGKEAGDGAGGIGAIHHAIATRAFAPLGPAAAPARALHDAISRGVYASLRGGAQLAGAGLARFVREGERPLSQTPRGAVLLGVLNGLDGDALEREDSPLQQPMALRVRDAPVPPEPDALAAAYPGATGRLVVFVHGLMETEHAWSIAGEGYGARLRRELGVTPLFIRGNTGRHISHNGRSLAELLEAAVAAWPVEVERIALVGHSMGGLIARSACHQAALEEHAWVRHVRHVVSLGTPHMGAPLAQGIHYLAHALHLVPETRAFARFLRRRSAGIRDLRQGSLVDADWDGRDPDALRAEACQEVPLLESATHCFVSATLTREARHPIGRLLGDALVLAASASGRSRTRRIPFEAEYGFHVGGAHHLALLDHPEVYERLRDWLRQPAAGVPT